MIIRPKCEAIVKARIVKGLSQRGLARESGLGNSYISQIERGLRNPGPKAARKIADALERPFDELFELVADDEPVRATA